MTEFSWDNPDLQSLCGECHYKDDDPTICHGIEPPGSEPPFKKPFVPEDGSSCFFIRESYWSRIPKEQKESFELDRKRRSEKYYEKNT